MFNNQSTICCQSESGVQYTGLTDLFGNKYLRGTHVFIKGYQLILTASYTPFLYAPKVKCTMYVNTKGECLLMS